MSRLVIKLLEREVKQWKKDYKYLCEERERWYKREEELLKVIRKYEPDYDVSKIIRRGYVAKMLEEESKADRKFFQSDADLAKWESERTWQTGSYPGGLLDTGAMADAAKDYGDTGKLYGPEDYVRAQVAAYTLVRDFGDGEQ